MARTFNGGSSRVTIDDTTSIRIAAPMSVSMWWRATTAVSSFEYILSKLLMAGDHSSYAFGFNSNTRPRFIIGYGYVSNEFISTPDQLDSHGVLDGGWHLWTGTYDGTDIQLWIDGIQHSIASSSHTIAYDAFPLTLGSFDGTQLYTPGEQAELCLWSAALTPSEITQLSKGISPELVRPDKLVHHWQMEGTVDPGYDVDLRKGVRANVITSAGRVAHPPIRRPVQPVYFDLLTPTVISNSGFMAFF